MKDAVLELEINNPFLDPTSLPHGAPPFDLLIPDVFLPAFKQAKDTYERELRTIAFNTAKPTFKNTIEAYESSGEAMNRLIRMFSFVTSSNNNEDIRNLSQQFNGRYSLNAARLFARVKKVYDARNALNLNQAERMLLEKTYRSFVRDGALLTEENARAIRKIDSELSRLGKSFSSNLQNSMASYQKVIDDEAELAGVPARAKFLYQQAAEEAGMPGKWLIGLLPSPTDVLSYCESRALREEISKANSRVASEGEYDNRDIALQIIKLRHKKAQILGYDNYASYALEDKMMDTPETVMEFLQKSKEANGAAAEEYLQKVRDFAAETDGITDLQSWDMAYYGRKLKEQTFGMDPEELRPYFEFENVLEGLHKHAEKLFKVKFTEVKGKYPVPHPDIRVYEVRDKKKGKLIGLFYGDYFARPGLKRNGAYASTIRHKDKNGSMTVVNFCNFSKPTPEHPTLLSVRDVETAFHEFGHAMHYLMSRDNYNSLTGGNVKRDFVEMPSQLQEKWVREKDVLKTLAIHYETGEPIPDELIQKMNDMNDFDAGYDDMRQTFLGMLDMKWHITDPSTIKSAEDLENSVREGMPSFLPATGIQSTSFRHIFTGGYAAGYYGYEWTRVLRDDVFAIFKEKGLYDKKTAKALRKTIYAKGAAKNPEDLFAKMTGHKPDPEALFRSEGEQMTRKKEKKQTSRHSFPKRQQRLKK